MAARALPNAVPSAGHAPPAHGRLEQHLRLALTLPRFLRRGWTVESATREVARRIADRPQRFLQNLDARVFRHPESPYAKLLRWAGCEYGDVASMVERNGVEASLTALRDAGVYVTLDEFKCTTPIRRSGLTIETHEEDFDNPASTGNGIASLTSGSRAGRARVVVDWEVMHEQAANELLLYELHGVARAPLVVWLPTLPGIAGTQNLLVNVLMGRAPQRWFSQVPLGGAASWNRIATLYMVACCRACGHRVPFPEHVGFDDAGKVVQALARANRGGGPTILRTYASSAVRVAQMARERGIDLRGTVAFTGGEPLTAVRREFLEGAGMQVFARYTGVDMGVVAASCAARSSTDDMHVYIDRLAVIAGCSDAGALAPDRQPLLYTSFSPHAGKVLLNADTGDYGRLESRPCDCAFGRIGLHLHVAGVRSFQKLTAEGLSVLASDFDQAVGRLVARAGGSPNDYECFESEDRDGLVKVTVAVHPALEQFDDATFLAELHRAVGALRKGNALATRVLPAADVIRVVRAVPRPNTAGKMRIARAAVRRT